MWKKTALKRLFKLLPKTNFSDQLIAAISTDHENEMNDLSPDQKYENIFDEIQTAEEVKETKKESKKQDTKEENSETKTEV